MHVSMTSLYHQFSPLRAHLSDLNVQHSLPLTCLGLQHSLQILIALLLFLRLSLGYHGVVFTLIPPKFQPPEDTYKLEAEAFPNAQAVVCIKFEYKSKKPNKSHDEVEMQQASLHGTSM